MNKKVALSANEWTILHQIPTANLRKFTELKDSGYFPAMQELIALMVDIDKNYFFAENEAKFEPIELAMKHAYYRGASGRSTELMRLIVGASQELLRREKEKAKE